MSHLLKYNFIDEDLREEFENVYQDWIKETQFLSTGITENPYYEYLSNMSRDIAPLIVEKLVNNRNSGLFIVSLFDKLFPDVIQWNDGYVPIDNAVEIWLGLLKPTFDEMENEFQERNGK